MENSGKTNLRVAVVHDWLVTLAGADRVVQTIMEIYPHADVYTLVYDEKKMGKYFPKEKVRTSFIQRFPKSTKIYSKLLPLMPYAFEEFDLNGYDLVISSSSCCAKGVITPPHVKHISYIHSPMRYAWDLYHEYKRESGKLVRFFMGFFMKNMRQWDFSTSQRIDHLIANSNFVAGRIRKFWRRESEVIHPPVEVERLGWNGKESEDFYVVFSRLVGYKRAELAIEACKRIGKNLVIIGDGPDRKKLEKLAKEKTDSSENPEILFVGKISDERVKDYIQRCRALIFCAEEDFGIIPLEVQGCGRPVIAYGRGGVLETVVEGVTGTFFQNQDVKSVAEAITRFEKMRFDSEKIVKHAEKFSKERFKREFESFVESVLA